MPRTERLYFLDWLRILAFGLLVLYHVGMYYVSWGWHVKSPFAGTALEPWMRLSSPWRMSLLFFVSGAASALMLARAGATRELIGQRARRLMTPLFFGAFVVVPPQAYFEVVQQHGYAGGALDFMRLYLSAYGGFCSTGSRCLILPTWNHLWFLPYLMAYTALLWAALRWRPGALDAAAARLPNALGGARLLWIPVLVLIGLRLTLRPLYPITHAFVADWYAHAMYGAMFLLGAIVCRGAHWPRLDALRWPALGVALLGGMSGFAPLPEAARLVAAGAMQWSAIVAAVGFAHRWLNRDAPWRRTLSEAVFPVYVLHQTVIVCLAVAWAPWRLEPTTEGPLLVLATFALCGLGYSVVRRIAWLRPCFGLAAADRPREPAPGRRPQVEPS